jgi:hypothetical protein
MGFFSRSTDTYNRATENLPAQYDDVRGKVVAGSNAALDKASEIYKKNPKLIGGLALVASALLLNKMRGGVRR